jgi:DNA-binding response OmpR family regulator
VHLSTGNEDAYGIQGDEMYGQARTMPPAYVVEDDVSMLHLLSELAASVGLAPRTFTRLASARRALREHPPAVLVIDDDLPDGQGADLVRELRADPRTRDVQVVMCTSAGPQRRRQIARLAPVVGKPFALREMETALRRAAPRPV